LDAITMGTVPVYSPEGQFGEIPQDNLQVALGKGFTTATQVTSPEGQTGWLPSDKVNDAITKRKFTIGNPAQDKAAEGQPSFMGDVAREVPLGFASNMGLPETTHPSDFSVAPGLWYMARHPVEAAKMVGGAMLDSHKNLFASADQDVDQGHDVLYDKNLPVGQRLKGAASAAGLAIMKEAAGMVPMVGPAAYNAAEELGTGVASGDRQKALHGAGGALGTLATVGMMHPEAEPIVNATVQGTSKAVTVPAKAAVQTLSKGAENIKTVINPVKYMTAEQAATKAIKPRNSKTNFPQELATALPDARRAADTLNIDPQNMTLDDAMNAVTQAKKDVWGEYQQNHSNVVQGLTADTHPVADAMAKTISNRMSAQNPSLAKRIQRGADEYAGNQMSMQEIEDRVKELNNQTRAIEARYITDKRAAKQNPGNAYLFAERDALRQLMLDKMNQITGPGAADLRQRWGNLNSVEDALSRRIPVADRQSPSTLSDLLAKTYGPGKIIGGLIQVGTGVGALHGLANIAEGASAIIGAKNAKLMNNPDRLIGHAFEKTNPTPSAKIPLNGQYMPPTPPASGPPFLYPIQRRLPGAVHQGSLPPGQYPAQSSPMAPLLQPLSFLQPQPTIGPARQLGPAKGIPLGPSGSTSPKNIEAVGLPGVTGPAISTPEGEAIAKAITSGKQPRDLKPPKGGNGIGLPFLQKTKETIKPKAKAAAAGAGRTQFPKQFAPPSAFGFSTGNNIVQQAQAAPAIQGPQFLPLNPQEEQQATPTPQTAVDPDQQYRDEVNRRFRQVGSPLSFYGGRPTLDY
jgi:hypothetical protein